MGIVIDMAAYRTLQDVSLYIQADNPEAADAGYSTDHLYSMALQAKKIMYYPSQQSGWKESCAFNIAKARS